jgi:serine/threonine-protein kinase
LLKQSATKSTQNLLNYTDMWEDELQRRFSSVAFVPLEPGQVLRDGSLRVVRHLAMGGLSAVYLCQLNENKLVVLKEAVVSADAVEATQVKAREMLDREAAYLLKLNNPNIVKVMDYFVEQGRNYLMLDYIDGQDLRQLVQQNGPRRESTVLEWAVSMAGMLKYLHEQTPPLIHRDFTPDNIVISNEGSLFLIDFGASNEFIGNATGTFVGKQAFIAPEQFRGKACVQSDIYAFGCTLYFLLTGQEPEALSTSNPCDINPTVSPKLAELVVCCTDMEPANRYQSAAMLIPILRSMAVQSTATITDTAQA